MPRKIRDYKAEYQNQLDRGEKERKNRLERERARTAYDKKGIDRTGKDIAHTKALSKGGKNSDGMRLQSPSKNRSFPRKSDGSMK